MGGRDGSFVTDNGDFKRRNSASGVFAAVALVVRN